MRFGGFVRGSMGPVILAALVACGPGEDAVHPTDPDNASEARRLAHELILVDTHIDVPYRLTEEMADVSRRTEGGDFDHPRATAGGLDTAFMSIYVPADLQQAGGAKKLADELIDMMEGLANDHPAQFGMVRRVADVKRQFEQGRFGLALGIENGAAIEGRLENLQHFYDRGVRYITLTHSKNNRICDSSYDDERKWNGLSPFGREVVAEMNRLGIMIDVSHVSDDTFWQVIEQTSAPVMATHSSCRHYTPEFERNMSDEMIVALKENGGVIQINFGGSFLDNDYRLARRAMRDSSNAEAEARGLEKDTDEHTAFTREYRKANAVPPVGVARVVDHIDHVVKLVGIDHVGLGSDFDGVGDSLPEGLRDVSEYPNLLRVLLERGYTAADIEKIASGNLLRVWSAVERVAAEN